MTILWYIWSFLVTSLTVKLLHVLVQRVIGFENVETKITDEFWGSIRYGGRVGEGIQKVIEVA